jgi:hypothetical protein
MSASWETHGRAVEPDDAEPSKYHILDHAARTMGRVNR